MIRTATAAEDAGVPLLPPEHRDGSWLLLPDLHGTGYGDVLRRDDAGAYTDPERVMHKEHWYSFHRRTWIDWADAVRLGAGMGRTLILAGPDGTPNSCPRCRR